MVLNKKTTWLSFSILALMLIGTYIYFDATQVNTIYSHSDWNPYKNTEELIDASDLVLIVTATGDKESIMAYDSSGILLRYWTESKVIVKEVLHNKRETLQQGEEITIIEPYAIGDNKVIGKLEILDEDYTKIMDKDDYLIHLKKRDNNGAYYPIGKDQGKINLSNSENTNFEEFQNEVKRAWSIRDA